MPDETPKKPEETGNRTVTVEHKGRGSRKTFKTPRSLRGLTSSSAQDTIIIEGMLMMGVITLGSFANKKPPRPAQYLSAALLMVGLMILAKPAPKFAAGLGGIAIVTTAITSYQGKTLAEAAIGQAQRFGTQEGPPRGPTSAEQAAAAVAELATTGAASVDQGVAQVAGTAAMQNPGGSTAKGSAAAQAALSQVGKPYVWGGESPAEGGFDCSGLIHWAWGQGGVSIPRTTYTQLAPGAMQVVPNLSQAQPGDLLFPHPGHVHMYLGNRRIVQAPRRGEVVKVGDATSYIAIRRPKGL